MFSCACGRRTNPDSEKSCRDCGHYPTFQEDFVDEYERREIRKAIRARNERWKIIEMEDREEAQKRWEAEKKKINEEKGRIAEIKFVSALEQMASADAYDADDEQ